MHTISNNNSNDNDNTNTNNNNKKKRKRDDGNDDNNYDQEERGDENDELELLNPRKLPLNTFNRQLISSPSPSLPDEGDPVDEFEADTEEEMAAVKREIFRGTSCHDSSEDAMYIDRQYFYLEDGYSWCAGKARDLLCPDVILNILSYVPIECSSDNYDNGMDLFLKMGDKIYMPYKYISMDSELYRKYPPRLSSDVELVIADKLKNYKTNFFNLQRYNDRYTDASIALSVVVSRDNTYDNHLGLMETMDAANRVRTLNISGSGACYRILPLFPMLRTINVDAEKLPEANGEYYGTVDRHWEKFFGPYLKNLEELTISLKSKAYEYWHSAWWLNLFGCRSLKKVLILMEGTHHLRHIIESFRRKFTEKRSEEEFENSAPFLFNINIVMGKTSRSYQKKVLERISEISVEVDWAQRPVEEVWVSRVVNFDVTMVYPLPSCFVPARITPVDSSQFPIHVPLPENVKLKAVLVRSGALEE